MSEDIKVYTLEEVASILKLSKRTLYSHFKNGTIPAVKIAGQWRVTEDQLKEFLSGAGSKQL